MANAYPGRDGRFYAVFAVGQPVLALPFYALGQLAGALLPASGLEWLAGRRGVAADPVRYGGSAGIFCVGLYAPLASGLLVGLFFLIQRQLGVSLRNALLAAALLGATSYAAAMSLFFLRHTTESLAILASLYALSGWRESGDLRALALGSLCAALTLLIRVPSAAAGPALGAYALWSIARRAREGAPPRASTWLALALPVLAVVAIHAAVDAARWGTPFASPMFGQSRLLTTPWHVGLGGLLLSPGSSLFVYSPLLLLLPWTLRSGFRSHPAECAALCAISVSLLLLSARFALWHGLWSAPGPRMLFALTPLLMLPLGRWLDGLRRPAAWGAVALLAGAGAVVQALLLTVSWAQVIAFMDLASHRPLGSFLFRADSSPLLGYAKLFAAGRLDGPWLLWLGRDTPARDGAPELAGLLLAGWAVCLAASAAGLWRCVGYSRRSRASEAQREA